MEPAGYFFVASVVGVVVVGFLAVVGAVVFLAFLTFLVDLAAVFAGVVVEAAAGFFSSFLSGVVCDHAGIDKVNAIIAAEAKVINFFICVLPRSIFSLAATKQS